MPLSRLRNLLSTSATDPDQGFLEVSNRAAPLGRLYRQAAKKQIYEQLDRRSELTQADLNILIESFVEVARRNHAASSSAGVATLESSRTRPSCPHSAAVAAED